MKYIIFISLLLSIFNNCQQKKQKKFSDKNLLILAILDSEYCKDPRVVYITASSSAVKDYNGVKYIDLYKSNSFVFRNTLDTSDVSRISFQFDLSMKKIPMFLHTVYFGVPISRPIAVQS